ncbi:MAG: hypothetical protein WAL98_11135 [Desulfatiglandaceae bacterium]
MKKIENLKKVRILWKPETGAENVAPTPKYPEFEFIFGLAPEGMTPFEYELLDKTEGESVQLHLKKGTFEQFFEHVNPPIMDLFEGGDEVHIRAEIVSIADAGSSEVIKAMAQMASYREGDCGCGCGCSN